MLVQNNNKGIIIIGSGGHAKVIADIIHSFRTYSISCSGRLKIEGMLSFRKGMKIRKDYRYIIGFGALDNLRKRDEAFQYIKKKGGIITTLISPHAIVSPDAVIGAGTVVMPRAVVGPHVRIGQNCIVNTGAIIEHDSAIGDNCHISTGAIVNGGCMVFDHSLIGSGAVLKQGIKIYRDTKIGAGAVVVKNIASEGKTFVGIPAEELV